MHQLHRFMMIHPGDEYGNETQQECENIRKQVPDGVVEILLAGDGGDGRNFDVNDEQGDGNGEYAVAKRFEPCIDISFFFHYHKSTGMIPQVRKYPDMIGRVFTSGKRNQKFLAERCSA